MSFPSAYVYYLKGVSMEFKNRHCFNWVFEKWARLDCAIWGIFPLNICNCQEKILFAEDWLGLQGTNTFAR